MVFKKWQNWKTNKAPVEKKEEVKEEIKEIEEIKEVEEVKEIKEEVIEEETPVSSVIENELSDVKEKKWKKSKDKIIWDVWWTVVAKPIGRIKFEAQVAPYPMFKLPADIREYLVKKGFTTEVYKKSKEWLEEHKVDMEMVEKLKKFLTEKL